MYSAPSSSSVCDQQSGSATIPLDEPESEAEKLPALPVQWDQGMSRIDKVTLASQLTQTNKASRLEFMRSASAAQGFEIVAAQFHAVRTAEAVKNLMEGSRESA